MVATREELEADRLALRNARTSLLTGGTVKSVERGDRRLVYAEVSVDSVNDAIAEIDRQLALFDGGTRRRRALSVGL
ncbi:gpW family head-tail joining protein [Rhizorhabdus sp.]|uniref:gpW family head-tail joining protein n=1 Tax=Rhizorhabdus sp. TaxID=1968843 RepID=UPI0035B15BE7